MGSRERDIAPVIDSPDIEVPDELVESLNRGASLEANVGDSVRADVILQGEQLHEHLQELANELQAQLNAYSDEAKDAAARNEAAEAYNRLLPKYIETEGDLVRATQLANVDYQPTYDPALYPPLELINEPQEALLDELPPIESGIEVRAIPVVEEVETKEVEPEIPEEEPQIPATREPAQQHADTIHAQPEHGHEKTKDRPKKSALERVSESIGRKTGEMPQIIEDESNLEVLSVDDLTKMMRRLEQEINRRHAQDGTLAEKPAEIIVHATRTRDKISEKAFASDTLDTRQTGRRVTWDGGAAGTLEPILVPKSDTVAEQPTVEPVSEAESAVTEPDTQPDAEPDAEPDATSEPEASAEDAPTEESPAEESAVESPEESPEESLEESSDTPKGDEAKEPKRFNLTPEEYLAERAARGGVLRTAAGFVDLRDEESKLRRFTTKQVYNEDIAGHELNPGDSPLTTPEELQARYNKINNIEPNGEVDNGPDYSKMTITELARELALTMSRYQIPAGEAAPKDGDVMGAEDAIRAAAKAKYLEAAENTQNQEHIDNYEEQMETFESMADRYLRAKLESDILHTEAGKETFKSTVKRWWSGVKNKFGVKKWQDDWLVPVTESPKALQKDVAPETPAVEREERQKVNRYNVILGHSVLFAQSPKLQNLYGNESLTWQVHAAELRRDLPNTLELVDDEVRQKAEGPLSDEDTKQLEIANKRLEQIKKFRDR